MTTQSMLQDALRRITQLEQRLGDVEDSLGLHIVAAPIPAVTNDRSKKASPVEGDDLSTKE